MAARLLRMREPGDQGLEWDRVELGHCARDPSLAAAGFRMTSLFNNLAYWLDLILGVAEPNATSHITSKAYCAADQVFRRC